MTQDCWSYSLRVRGPHFASKVSYNAGAATDDYAGQIKAEPVFIKKRWLLRFSLPPLLPTHENSPPPQPFEGLPRGEFSLNMGAKGAEGHTLSR